MKRQGDLWDRLTSFPNLLRAATRASRGKRGSASVARFHFDLERQLCRLQDELRAKTYVPGRYWTFRIYEPKLRLISAAPYRDRVVHHALCGVIEPVFEPTFIFDSYACRRGKGTHAAVDRFTTFARRNRYVLKCDVSKFFPSIDHEILKALVARKIKDRDVLWLANLIVDSSNLQETVDEWFAGDDLLAPLARRRGLPIGNQTSQFFANVYLNPLDHFVKETVRIGDYCRYADDFVLFADDPRRLAEARAACREFLCSLRLRLHAHKSVVSRVVDGTRFLGYRVFPGHRLLARENVTRMKRRLKRLQRAFAAGQIGPADLRRRLVGWIGHAAHADTFRLRERLFRETSFSRRAP
jgi:retron-type reverse transcriptase